MRNLIARIGHVANNPAPSAVLPKAWLRRQGAVARHKLGCLGKAAGTTWLKRMADVTCVVEESADLRHVP